MTKRMKHIALLALLLAPLFSAATILRVNPDPLALAPFTDLQSAHDAALPGDTIFAEGNQAFVEGGFGPAYSVTVTKQLFIIGPGYFLTENNSDIELNDEAWCSSVELIGGSEGSVLERLVIDQLFVGADNVVIKSNHLRHTDCNDANSIELKGNFMQGVIPGIPVLTMDGINVSNIHHNIILHDDAFTSGQFSVFEIGTFGNLYANNVIGHANSVMQFAQANNNIFKGHTFDDIDGTNFENNIFEGGFLEVALFDLMGNPNDPTPIVGNATNLLGANMLSVMLLTASLAPDAQFQLTPGSPALGFGNDGDNAGPYTNFDPYDLSGFQSIPLVITLDVNPSDNLVSEIPVTFQAISTETTININQAEYFIGNDPGFGEGIPISIVPGPAVLGFFGILTADVAPGTYVLGLRVQDDLGQWSQDAFATFEVEDEEPIPGLDVMQFSVSEADVIDFSSFTDVPSALGGNIESFIQFIDLTPYPEGMVLISFRMKDLTGRESVTFITPILVIEEDPPPAVLDYLEYYADDDPGYQNGQIIELVDGANFFSGTVTQELTGLPLGPHNLWIRLRDVEGHFSVTQLREVHVVTELFALVDMNNDCSVDVLDLLIFLGNYGCTDPDLNDPCPADFDMNGIVDAVDLLTFLGMYGQSCTP